MTAADEFLREAEQINALAQPLQIKYTRLYALLYRTCKQITAADGVSYSNLFSLLHAVCRKKGYPPGEIETFRIHARDIKRDCAMPQESEYPNDLRILCEALSHFTGCPIPPSLKKILPSALQNTAKTAAVNKKNKTTFHKRIRIIVTEWKKGEIKGYGDDSPDDIPLTADYSASDEYCDLHKQLYVGAQLNLLCCRYNDKGILQPEQIVLEPDYLMDISALAECFQPYGASPWNYLLQKIKPSESNAALLMGNAANLFLDDCVNEQNGTEPLSYESSIRKFFKEYALPLSVCEGIDAAFFYETKQQFTHIREVVQKRFATAGEQETVHNVVLEPSFLCEALGLQGRMDFLQTDGRVLIELKSGKADEMRHSSRTPHALQMALYKEMLYYNMDIPREQVESYLFYSKYPTLFAERSSKQQIARAIALRNKVVSMEQRLKEGTLRPFWQRLTPDDLNKTGEEGKLWKQYVRPRLQALLTPLHSASPLALSYFYEFTAFTAREQYLSKAGGGDAEWSRSLSDLWNVEADEKRMNGNLLDRLEITGFTEKEGIEKIAFRWEPDSESSLPNFRKNDIVVLYERNRPEDQAVRRRIFRGTIEEINEQTLLIHLHCKQRNRQVFKRESRYAVEHDFMDSSFRSLFQGLYAFLSAPERRQRLLLGQRVPERDTGRTLQGHYENEEIQRIVLQAKQAKDCFLLVGPPGTGKTSMALKSIVQELCRDGETNLLLMTYTNRAVDEICEVLENMKESIPEYVRIGSELSCDKKFTKRLLKHITEYCNNRRMFTECLSGWRIFVGTVAALSGKPELFRLKHFQTAIIDEASQILEPQIVGLLSMQDGKGCCAIDKFILIGDHKQLPAVVQQGDKTAFTACKELQQIGIHDMRRSLFERFLYTWRQHPTEGMVAVLARQGRMHPAVSRLAGRYFYDDKLRPIPLPHQTAPLEFTEYDESSPFERLIATCRTAFIPCQQAATEEPPKTNRSEAQITARLVKAFHRLCLKNGLQYDPAHQIGIIVPFRNQIAVIYQELNRLNLPYIRNITIDTVERYQGSQRDVIVFCTTVSKPYQLQMLSDSIRIKGRPVDRKLNVAITRARKQLFVTGNPEVLSTNPLYLRLMKDMGTESPASV